MAFRLRIKRGLAALISTMIPNPGELLFNLTDRSLRVGDGVTLGGVKVLATQDRYDLKLKTTTTQLDIALAQVFVIAHNATRAITILNPPAPGRTLPVVLIINGSTGIITWPSNVQWSGNVVPTLGTVQTVLTLLWNGVNWTGSIASSID